MPLLHWRQNMSLGHEALDADHKHLIDLMNRLHYMMLAGDEAAAIKSTLDDLLHFVQYHFEREEGLMRRCSYPHREAHKRLHHELAERLRMFQSAYEWSPETFDRAEFYDFVTDWLLVHFLCEDMRIKPYVATGDAGAEAETA